MEPEHRAATVAFLRFSGVDALHGRRGPDAVAEALDEVITAVQDAATPRSVTFLATDIDEDGGKVILATGVPPAQADDEGRMLRCRAPDRRRRACRCRSRWASTAATSSSATIGTDLPLPRSR